MKNNITDIKKITKKIKTSVKNNIYKLINLIEKKSDESKFNKLTIGTYLRALHITAPFYLLIHNLYVPKIILIMNIIFLLIAFVIFYIFNGCFLTIIERKLCKDKFTFIDPFLEYYNYPINKKNQNEMSVKIAIIYLIITFFIYFLRFHIN